MNTRDSRQIRRHRVRPLVLGGAADAGAEQVPMGRPAIHRRQRPRTEKELLGQPRAVRGASEATPALHDAATSGARRLVPMPGGQEYLENKNA